MKIRDLIIDIGQMSQSNRMYSRLNGLHEDRQREDEAARLTMEVMPSSSWRARKRRRRQPISA